MTQQDYDKKKRECWEEFLQKHEISRADGVTADAFIMAFDRAYALGKQEKDTEEISLWERLTDREKHNLRRHYHRDECVLRDHKKRTGDKAQTRATARMRLLENLFGKDNINPCDDE